MYTWLQRVKDFTVLTISLISIILVSFLLPPFGLDARFRNPPIGGFKHVQCPGSNAFVERLGLFHY